MWLYIKGIKVITFLSQGKCQSLCSCRGQNWGSVNTGTNNSEMGCNTVLERENPSLYSNTKTILKGGWEGNLSRRMVPARRGGRHRIFPLYNHHSKHWCRQKSSRRMPKPLRWLGTESPEPQTIPHRLFIDYKVENGALQWRNLWNSTFTSD